ncbi:MAG: hypothetical protein JWQ49_1243 [Edaphobacter sp.]|nr:hypothetical protein [Edaphobacter sp.]
MPAQESRSIVCDGYFVKVSAIGCECFRRLRDHQFARRIQLIWNVGFLLRGCRLSLIYLLGRYSEDMLVRRRNCAVASYLMGIFVG